jgi:hypothetical protein
MICEQLVAMIQQWQQSTAFFYSDWLKRPKA